MDSVNIVQPVLSTLPESIADLPSIQDLPTVDTRSSSEQLKLSSGADTSEGPLPAFQIHETSTSEEVVAVAVQYVNKLGDAVLCEGRKVEGSHEIVQTLPEDDSGTLAERAKELERSSDAAQTESRHTVDIEVEIAVDAGDGGSTEPDVVDATLPMKATDIVETAVLNMGTNSNAEGISVEVVLEEEVRHDDDQSQIVSSRIEGEKQEDLTGAVVAVDEAAGIEILAGRSDLVVDGGANPGLKLEVEPMVVEDAETVHHHEVNGTAGNDLGGEGKVKESEISTTPQSETGIAMAALEEVVEVVVPTMSAPCTEEADAVERDAMTDVVPPEVTMTIVDSEDAKSISVEDAPADQVEGGAEVLSNTGNTTIGIEAMEAAELSAVDTGKGTSGPVTERIVEESSIVVELGSEADLTTSDGGNANVFPQVLSESPNADDQSLTEMMDVTAEESSIAATAALDVSRTSEDTMDSAPVLVPSSESNGAVDTPLLPTFSHSRQNRAAEGVSGAVELEFSRSKEPENSVSTDALPVVDGLKELNPSDLLMSTQSDLSKEERSIVVELNSSSAFLTSEDLGDTVLDGIEDTPGAEVVLGSDPVLPAVPDNVDALMDPTSEEVDVAAAAARHSGHESTSAEENAIVEEPGTSSNLVFATDVTQLDDHTGTPIDAATEELPPVTVVPATDVLPEIPVVLCSEENTESRIQEQIVPEDKSSVIPIEVPVVTSTTENAAVDIPEQFVPEEKSSLIPIEVAVATSTTENAAVDLAKQFAPEEKSSVISIEVALTSTTENAAVDLPLADTPAIELEIRTTEGTACDTVMENFEEDTVVEKVEEDTEVETAEVTGAITVSEEERSEKVSSSVDTTMAEEDTKMEISDVLETTFVKTVITVEDVSTSVTSVDNHEVSLVAVDASSTLETSVAVLCGDGNEVDEHGVLIGVGSCVERSGLKITEITALAEENSSADKQKRSLSDEPLITSPLEEGISHVINDIFAADKNAGEREVLSQDVGGEINASQSSLLTSETGEKGAEKQAAQAPVVVDEAVLEVGSKREKVIDSTASLGAAAAAASDREEAPATLENAGETAVFGAQDTSLETTSAATSVVDFAMESMNEEIEVIVPPPVSDEEKEASSVIVPKDSKEPVGSDEVCVKADLGTAHSATQSEISIVTSEPLMSLKKQLPLSGDATKEVAEQLTSIVVPEVDNGITSCEEGSSVVAVPADTSVMSLRADSSISTLDTVGVTQDLASTANGLGVGTLDAADSFARKDKDADLATSELRFAEDSVAVVDMTLDGKGESGALDSAMVGEDKLMVVEEATIEINEKKRGREEEEVIPEDVEKTSKSAKTANGEVTVVTAEANAVQVNDAKVDKKRARDESGTPEDEAEALLKAKAPKTNINDDDVGSQSPKSDMKEDVDVDVDAEELGKDESVEVRNESTSKRYKKRKIAMFLGYCGAGYQGMQKNPGAVTIEGELEEALFRAGAIQASNYGEPKKVDWRRAARTDKGVSAVGQVVSGSFIIDPPNFVERVNSHLPKQIRLYGYKRVTASFNAKKLCDRRKYEYILPVYAFDPSVHLDRESVRAQSSKEVNTGKETEELNVQAINNIVAGTVKDTKELNVQAINNIVAGTGEVEMTMITDGNMLTDAALAEGEVEAGNGGLELVDKETMPVAGSVCEVEEIVIDNNQSCSNGTAIMREEVNVIMKVTTENETTTIAEEDVTMVTIENHTIPKEDNVVSSESQPMTLEAIQEVEARTAEQKSMAEEEAVNVEIKNDAGIEQEVVAMEASVERELNAEEKKQALDEKVKSSTYKFGDEELNRLNKILRNYVGSHNFHNFTNRVKPEDPSAQRYIVSFEAEDVFTIDGIEFVRCTVVGQSFMLHQIRKMIGLAVAIMRGNAPESIIDTALRRDTDVNMPMAPELGLFLEECYYASYNKRFRATHDEISLIPFAKDVKEFKKEFIYQHIAGTEAKDSTFALWLHSINDRHFPHFVEAREKAILDKSE